MLRGHLNITDTGMFVMQVTQNDTSVVMLFYNLGDVKRFCTMFQMEELHIGESFTQIERAKTTTFFASNETHIDL